MFIPPVTDRERALSNALAKSVDLFRSLPMNPLIAQHIRECERINAGLDETAQLPMIGDAYTPSGIGVVGVVVSNGKATVFSEAPAREARSVFFALQGGVQFSMHPLGKYRMAPQLARQRPGGNAAVDVTTDAARWRMSGRLGLLQHVDVARVDAAIEQLP